MPRAERHRRHLTAAACALLCATCALAATTRLPQSGQSAPAASQSAGAFPTIESEALDKTSVTLPQKLEGRRNLLLLSWARDQTPQVNSWTAVAQALEHADPDIHIYHIPVSTPENPLFRWWDNSSLRTDETDPELLHWIVPIYTDKAALRRALNVPANDHQMLALLVDRSGRVLWKAQGPSTTASRRALLAAAQAPH